MKGGGVESITQEIMTSNIHAAIKAILEELSNDWLLSFIGT